MASGQMFKKVKLKDVDVLTLYQGKMTNGRRSSPVPQLSCKGGTAGCGSFVPEVVQCYNRGSDGLDIQWECKTDMDTKFRFGKISVSCEGYDYPEDPFILAGSCGLDYTIDRVGATNTGYNTGSNSYSSYQAPKSSTSTDDDWEINWVFVAIVCIICWAMWKNVTDENPNGNGNGIPPAGTEPSEKGAGPVPAEKEAKADLHKKEAVTKSEPTKNKATKQSCILDQDTLRDRSQKRATSSPKRCSNRWRNFAFAVSSGGAPLSSSRCA